MSFSSLLSYSHWPALSLLNQLPQEEDVAVTDIQRNQATTNTVNLLPPRELPPRSPPPPKKLLHLHLDPQVHTLATVLITNLAWVLVAGPTLNPT